MAEEQDLILFENQLPYFLLQELYQELYQKKQDLPCSWPTPSNDHSIETDKAKGPHDALIELTCEFFKDYKKGKPVENIGTPKHFTDLVRHFQCPDKAKDGKHNSTPFQNIYAAKKLRASGVKFRPLKDGPFIIKIDEATKCKFNLECVRNMDLKLTPFGVKEDETECVVQNIMALEQFLYPDKPYICNYFLLMDQLVDTLDEVDLLVENKVIINMLGSNKALAKLVDRLCEQIMDDPSCYFGISDQLNKHYENFWNRHVATLKRVYFKDLWTGSSTVLGVFVLLFSVSGTTKYLMS
ncbi:unnamed protein product [Prunus armeniaca]